MKYKILATTYAALERRERNQSYRKGLSSKDVIRSWTWAFGDGVTSIVQNPVHSYTHVGIDDVQLTVHTDTYTKTITSVVTTYQYDAANRLSNRNESRGRPTLTLGPIAIKCWLNTFRATPFAPSLTTPQDNCSKRVC